MRPTGNICFAITLALVVFCAPAVMADDHVTLSEARLRIAQDVSRDLRTAPEPKSSRRTSSRRTSPQPSSLRPTKSPAPAQKIPASKIPAQIIPASRTAASRTPTPKSRQAAPTPPASKNGPPIIRQVSDESILIPLESETVDAGVQLSDESILIPLESEPGDADVQLEGDDGLVTLVATGAELTSVLRMIANHHSLNLVLGPDVGGPVTVSIRGAQLEEILDAILGVAGFVWHRDGNLLYVTGATTPGMAPRVQGRELRIYQLDYVAAVDVEDVANGLLSPVGTAFITESDPTDQLKTRELLVVDDTPSVHRRIAEYIAQVNIPPRQVLIEAHVLQVALGEEERHGINLEALARFQGAKIAIKGTGFAETTETDPSVAIVLEGSDVNSLIELIHRETNSRTLASPKVSVINRQEAKIQIGQRLPYSVATTTQTTTVQSVNFLDVGIVLTVQPMITEDGNVLMTIFPKVSGGKITENGFPEEDTTEVQTTVMLPDGGGMVIGGLIREDNVNSKARVLGLSRIPVLGRLFKKRADESRRNELIIALVAHVLPVVDACGPRTHEMMELEQVLPDYSASELQYPQLPVMIGP